MDDEQERKKDKSKIESYFLNIFFIFFHLRTIKNYFFKFEEDIEKDDIEKKKINIPNDNTLFAYVSAFSTHFYAFYEVLKDLNSNLKNIYRYYAYRLNNTQSLLDQLNFPTQINNYFKHLCDYEQRINEINNYLYEKNKKTLFLFLTKNGNFDEKNFNYGKKILFQDPSSKFKNSTKHKNIYDIFPYILFNNTKYVVHKFKEVFNSCSLFIESLWKQNFFIEMHKRNYIHNFIQKTNEGYYDFFCQMKAYFFNDEKILKQIQMKLELNDIYKMKKIDLLIFVDLNKILINIYFRLPTNKTSDIKIGPKLIACCSDYNKQCVCDIDQYFNFNNLEKDIQITCIKYFAVEFRKDILKNKIDINSTNKSYIVRFCGDELKKDFTNKLYFVRFNIVFLFHNLKVIDLKKNIIKGTLIYNHDQPCIISEEDKNSIEKYINNFLSEKY